jgi:hypothetical protein
VTSVQGGTRLIAANHAANRDLGAAPSKGIGRVLRDTPRRINLMTVGLVIAGLVLGLVYAFALARDSSSLSSLDARTAEVSATSDLYYRLNDMDAQAANVLLVGYNPVDPSMVPPSVDAAASDKVYEQDRSAADADLEQIAANPALTKQAGSLLDSLGSYEAQVADAFYIDQNTQKEQPGTPPATALSLYTQASALLHSKLLSAAGDITQADGNEVGGSYSADHSAITGFGFALLGLALFAAALMALGNRYYARRFQRRLGFLALAAVVALVLGITGVTTQLSEANQLHVAKQSAYDSIYALDRALAVSDDANGTESRWLLDGQDPSTQDSFFSDASQIVSLSGPTPDAAADPLDYYSDAFAAIAKVQLDPDTNTVTGVTFGGFLGTELDNITFPGEGQAAVNAVHGFDAYLQDDQKIRADAASGDLAGAVALDIGLQPGQSNYDFNKYMTALGSVVQVNTTFFDAAVADGRSGADAATWTEMVVGELLLLVCVAQAAYLRLREYR